MFNQLDRQEKGHWQMDKGGLQYAHQTIVNLYQKVVQDNHKVKTLSQSTHTTNLQAQYRPLNAKAQTIKEKSRAIQRIHTSNMPLTCSLTTRAQPQWHTLAMSIVDNNTIVLIFKNYGQQYSRPDCSDTMLNYHLI